MERLVRRGASGGADIVEAFRAIALAQLSAAESKFLRKYALAAYFGGDCEGSNHNELGYHEVVMRELSHHYAEPLKVGQVQSVLRARGLGGLSARLGRCRQARNEAAHPFLANDIIEALGASCTSILSEEAGKKQATHAEMQKTVALIAEASVQTGVELVGAPDAEGHFRGEECPGCKCKIDVDVPVPLVVARCADEAARCDDEMLLSQDDGIHASSESQFVASSSALLGPHCRGRGHFEPS